MTLKHRVEENLNLYIMYKGRERYLPTSLTLNLYTDLILYNDTYFLPVIGTLNCL